MLKQLVITEMEYCELGLNSHIYHLKSVIDEVIIDQLLFNDNNENC